MPYYFAAVMPSPSPQTRSPGGSFVGYWATATLTTAVVLTAADAALLERSRGYFTGGFLSVDHLAGAGDVVSFLLLSLLADAAVAGTLAGVAIWVLACRGVRADACGLAGLLAGLVPLTIADIIAYELVRYLLHRWPVCTQAHGTGARSRRGRRALPAGWAQREIP